MPNGKPRTNPNSGRASDADRRCRRKSRDGRGDGARNCAARQHTRNGTAWRAGRTSSRRSMTFPTWSRWCRTARRGERSRVNDLRIPRDLPQSQAPSQLPRNADSDRIRDNEPSYPRRMRFQQPDSTKPGAHQSLQTSRGGSDCLDYLEWLRCLSGLVSSMCASGRLANR